MSSPAFSITPEAFVQEFKDLKEHLLAGYFSPGSGISRIAPLQQAGLTEAQIAVAREVVSGALTDALYTVLLGLEGSASIHQHQILYKLFDEQSNELTGHIESIAWEKFHGEDA